MLCHNTYPKPRDVLFEFHLKFWNTASIGIPVRRDIKTESQTFADSLQTPPSPPHGLFLGLKNIMS